MISFRGAISAPPSKSSSIRALICAILSHTKPTTINNISLCDDVTSAINLFRELGFQIELDNNNVVVKSYTPTNLKELNCGESGFLARVMTSLTTYFKSNFSLNGEKTLLARSIDFQLFCQSIGLNADSNHLPVNINGSITSPKLTIDASTSSQFLSGLLFTLPLLNHPTEIEVKKLVSSPYLRLTLKYLSLAGINFNANHDLSRISISGNQNYKIREIVPESDWSSMSFIIALGIMNGNIKIENICDSDDLPDRVIIDIIKNAGGNLEFKNNILYIKKSELTGFECNITNNPDLAPILVALAIAAQSKSTIHGCMRLIHKESNRLMAIMDLLKSLDVNFTLDNNSDSLTIYPSQISGATIKTYGDHRIAMTALVLNSIATSKIEIDNYDCINKSFPEFLEIYNKLGETL